MKYLILIAIVLLVSCSPCKHVAKHPEYFPADTIVITNDVIHYEKEIIINDSIVRDTVPCDPVTNTYYKTNTVYKTNYKTIIDTIYQSREISRINPLNQVLKKTNDKLELKIKRHNKVIRWLVIALGSIILLIIGYIKLK
jgi:cyanate lyase